MSLVSQICAYVISKTVSVMVDIVLHAKAFVQSSELFDTLNVPKDTRAIYVQNKRFSKCEKELATETFDTNSTAFAKPFSVLEMKITRSQNYYF